MPAPETAAEEGSRAAPSAVLPPAVGNISACVPTPAAGTAQGLVSPARPLSNAVVSMLDPSPEATVRDVLDALAGPVSATERLFLAVGHVDNTKEQKKAQRLESAWPLLEKFANDPNVIEVLKRITGASFVGATYDARAYALLERTPFPGKREFFRDRAPRREEAAEAFLRLGYPEAPGVVANAVVEKLASAAEDRDSFAETFFPVMEAHCRDPRVIEALEKIVAMSFDGFPYDTRALLALDKAEFTGKKELLVKWQAKRKRADQASPGMGAPDLCDVDRLNDTQLLALANVRNRAVDLSNLARGALVDRLEAERYAASDLETCLAFMRDEAPITINFNPDQLLAVKTPGFKEMPGVIVNRGQSNRVIDSLLAAPSYRSVFETGITCGNDSPRSGEERDRWEKTVFAGDYHRGAFDPATRPKYGAVNAQLNVNGGAHCYGTCYFVLKSSVRKRVTITPLDSLRCKPSDVGTLDHCMHVLVKTDAAVFRDLANAAVNGQRCDRQCFYIEMQIHGPVDLTKDVDQLVADPSFRGTPYEAKLRELCRRDGIALMWKSPQGTVADDGAAAPAAAPDCAGGAG